MKTKTHGIITFVVTVVTIFMTLRFGESQEPTSSMQEISTALFIATLMLHINLIRRIGRLEDKLEALGEKKH